MKLSRQSGDSVMTQNKEKDPIEERGIQQKPLQQKSSIIHKLYNKGMQKGQRQKEHNEKYEGIYSVRRTHQKCFIEPVHDG